ncbi:hypothetical protein L083_7541 [Actinoplanes sp. N902-109]|nr:hypothetical protein L083_7541 [Actinoplanes sp. N902-109]
MPAADPDEGPGRRASGDRAVGLLGPGPLVPGARLIGGQRRRVVIAWRLGGDLGVAAALAVRRGAGGPRPVVGRRMVRRAVILRVLALAGGQNHRLVAQARLVASGQVLCHPGPPPRRRCLGAPFRRAT